MKSLSILGVFVLFIGTFQAQSRVALTPATAAHPSSILDMRTTQSAGSEKGFLMTRMDSAVRVNIASPANALWVYQNKEDTGYYYYDVNRWRRAHMTYGTVQMDNQSSLTLNGSNSFSVEHLAPGVDQVSYNDYLLPNPIGRNHIIVMGENTEAPLQLHENASNYCVLNYNVNSQPPAAFSAYINNVTISNGGTTLVQNTGSFVAQSSYYSHPLLDNSIMDCVAQGNTLTFNVFPFGTFPNQRLQVWIDWNADGNFDAAETVYGQTYSNIPSPQIFNVAVPAIPINAQAKFTAVRIMARTFQTNTDLDGCLAPQASGYAEVEDYYIPLCSNSGTYPILKPFCSVNESNFSGFQVYCQDNDGEPINVKYHFKVHER